MKLRKSNGFLIFFALLPLITLALILFFFAHMAGKPFEFQNNQPPQKIEGKITSVKKTEEINRWNEKETKYTIHFEDDRDFSTTDIPPKPIEIGKYVIITYKFNNKIENMEYKEDKK